ncbi:MAG: CoA ester lyase [Pseudomonadota bacterium]
MIQSGVAEQPIWRSLLFIPAHRADFVLKAHLRGADAYVLDLEDSVPDAQKSHARSSITDSARTVSQSGAAALVRINQGLRLAVRDLEACVCPEVQAVVIPKVRSGDQLQGLTQLIDELELELGMNLGHTRLVAQIECVHGLSNLDSIACCSPRMAGMTLGSEDFSASAGMEPTPETLVAPNQAIVFACRRAGIQPLGFPASIADYSDSEQFKKTVRFAREMGFTGALCIHPRQVSALNDELIPSAAEVEQASALLAAYEQGLLEGNAAVAFEGKMIDAPVVARARETLRRSDKAGSGSQRG